MRSRIGRRSAQIPAWVPRLDARGGRRRPPWPALAFALLSACLSYGLVEPGPGAPAPEPEGAAGLEASLRALAEDWAARDAAPAPAATASAEAPAPVEMATLEVITGRIPAGGTVARSLRDQGVSLPLVSGLGEVIEPLFDFRNAQQGDFFALIRDSDGELLSFEFQRGRRDIYRAERGPDGALRASHAEVPLERRVVQLGGIIERSLFETLLDLGEGRELVDAFANIFMWDFDFARLTRPGDEFRLVYEKYYDRQGFVRYGEILAARYQTSEQQFTAVYFEDEAGSGDYYSPQGNSVQRTFLRAPVRYSRISSRYSRSRLHPILKVRRPHYGVDYAAPAGAPVWSVADGDVIFKGWSGGLGRLVKVRHDNGYVSYYGHLSRFAKGIRAGSRLRQKDVVGYVGSSGLSTGPHVDYRLKVGSRFVDPLKLRSPNGGPVPAEARERFEEVLASRLRDLNSASPPLVLEAAM